MLFHPTALRAKCAGGRFSVRPLENLWKITWGMWNKNLEPSFYTFGVATVPRKTR
ncbi:MAG: hypothetical protein JWQ02_3408 [Capsulimonas sp.]|nr:hypothetical protein [Capsulimonas sp.]